MTVVMEVILCLWVVRTHYRLVNYMRKLAHMLAVTVFAWEVVTVRVVACVVMNGLMGFLWTCPWTLRV